jgi:uncharacterized protein YcfJ
MKSFITAALLITALLIAPVTQAASYQDRAMATGAVVGATTGAVIGSGHNQVIEGAIFGAVLGTIAGAIIANQHRPAYVVQHQPRAHYKPVRHQYERRSYKQSYSRSNNRQHNQYATTRSYDHERRERGTDTISARYSPIPPHS